MPPITVARTISAPPEKVWPHLADLASHVEWMRDTVRIVFTSQQTGGVGTRMEVLTRVGPFRTRDLVEVTGWKEGESVEIAHRGLVKGTASLSVRPGGDGSRVTWVEDLVFPWVIGGPITAWAARPILAAIFRGNLARLEERISSP